MEVIFTTSQFAVLLVAILLAWLLVSYLPRLESPIPGPSFFSQFRSSTEMGQLMRKPHAFTSVLHKLSATHGRVFSIWLGPTRTIVSSHPEDLLQIYVNTKVFPRPPSFTEALRLFSPRGINNMPLSEREDARRIIHHNFNRSILDSSHSLLADALREMCGSLATKAGRQGSTGVEINISEAISLSMFRVLTKVLFGIDMDLEERKRFSDNVDNLFEGVLVEALQYPFRQLLVPFGVRRTMERSIKKVRDVMEDIVRKRMANATGQANANCKDLIDVVLKVGNGNIEVACSVILEFAFAGAHTTSQVLVWSMFELCINPNVARKMQQEIDNVFGKRHLDDLTTKDDLSKMPYVMAVWKETHRLHPANGGTLRIATRAFKLSGTGALVEKGTQVLGFSGAAQLDSKIWKHPAQFRPERWIGGKYPAEGDTVPPGTYAPFGIGSLSCLGRFLADHEGPMALAELFRRFDFRLACKDGEVVTHSFFVDSARVCTKEGLQLSRGLPVHANIRTLPIS